MDFEAKEKNLSSLLLVEKLNIPYNQRAFSWKESQIDGFYHDLKHCAENSKKHFLGTIITNQNQKNRNILDVIDGQQRITVFFLFNAALVETGLRFIKDKKEFTLKEDDDSSQKNYAEKINDKKKEFFSFFKKFIDFEESILKINPSWKDAKGYNQILNGLMDLYDFNVHLLDVSNDATSQISYSYDRIIKHFQTHFNLKSNIKKLPFDDEEILNRIMNLLRILNEDFKIVDCTVKDGEPNTIFDNLNTRGEPLSTLDIIRNAVFSELQGNHELQKKFNNEWMTIERGFLEPFTKNAQRFISKDDVFMHKLETDHIKNYWFPFGTTLNSNLSNKKLNSQIKFSLDSLAKHEEDPLKRCKIKSKELSRYISLYNALSQNYIDEKINNYPDELKEKIFMLYRIKCPNTSYSYIFKSVDYYLNTNDQSKKNDILYSYDVLESRIMRDSLSGKTSSKDFLLTLFKNIELHDYDFKLARFFLKTKSYPFPKDQEIVDLIKDHPLDKYKRLTYLLEEIEIEDKSTSTLKKTFLNLNYNSLGNRDLDVDHFMPQNNTYWKNYLEKEGFDLDGKQYENIVGNIGNLFLLHRAINSKKKNKGFVESKKIISEDTTTNISNYMKSISKWTPNEIQIRSKLISDFFIKRWPSYKKHNSINLQKENKKSQLELEAKEKFHSIFNSFDIEAKYLGLTINAIDRNYPTVNKDLYNYFLEHKVIDSKKDSNLTSKRLYIRFFDDVDFSEIVMNIYRASRERGDEVTCSFENLKELAKANDVLGIFVKNKQLYVVNLSNIANLSKRLELI